VQISGRSRRTSQSIVIKSNLRRSNPLGVSLTTPSFWRNFSMCVRTLASERAATFPQSRTLGRLTIMQAILRTSCHQRKRKLLPLTSTSTEWTKTPCESLSWHCPTRNKFRRSNSKTTVSLSACSTRCWVTCRRKTVPCSICSLIGIRFMWMRGTRQEITRRGTSCTKHRRKMRRMRLS